MEVIITNVYLSKHAIKDIRKLPNHILKQFEYWVKSIEKEGIESIQRIKGYRDHPLIGDRLGQRSSSLSRSWRVIYLLDERSNSVTVSVLEVNKHDY